MERERIANEKWLEDHLGLVTNTYLSLMQVQTIATFSFTDKGLLIIMSHSCVRCLSFDVGVFVGASCCFFLWLQAELVKFQETVLLLQDYYGGMAEAVPAQLPPPARLPLIEVQTTLFSPYHSIMLCVWLSW